MKKSTLHYLQNSGQTACGIKTAAPGISHTRTAAAITCEKCAAAIGGQVKKKAATNPQRHDTTIDPYGGAKGFYDSFNNIFGGGA